MSTATATASKPPRRQRTTKPPKPETATEQKPPKTTEQPKQKLTLYVTADGAKRLAVHATMLGTDRSALVEELIANHLKRFRVQELNQSESEPTVDPKKPVEPKASDSTDAKDRPAEAKDVSSDGDKSATPGPTPAVATDIPPPVEALASVSGQSQPAGE